MSDEEIVRNALDALRFYDPDDQTEPRKPHTIEADGLSALARIITERDEQAKAWHKVNRQLITERDELRAELERIVERAPGIGMNIPPGPIDEAMNEARTLLHQPQEGEQ